MIRSNSVVSTSGAVTEGLSELKALNDKNIRELTNSTTEKESVLGQAHVPPKMHRDFVGNSSIISHQAPPQDRANI